MATPPNPAVASSAAPGGDMLSTILGALANRASTNPGQDFSQQSAALQGADPSMVLRQLEACNQMLGVLFVKTFQTLPNVANQVSATMKALSRAIKEAQQASNVNEAVGASAAGQGAGAPGAGPNPPPINFAAVTPGQTDQGAMT